MVIPIPGLLRAGFITVAELAAAINNTVNNDLFGVREIKNEIIVINDVVSAINNTINDGSVGLNEIKNEIQIIENTVLDPVFGLSEIKTEVANIESLLLNPLFGLNETKAEIIAINNLVVDINATLNNSTFGLNEIKNEIQIIQNEVSQINQALNLGSDLSTGAVIRDNLARNLVFKVINTSPSNANIVFTVWNYDACPANCFFQQNFTVPQSCSNDVNIEIFNPGGNPTLNNYEVTVTGVVPGVYVFTSTTGSPTGQSLSAANTFRSGDFVARAFNTPCPNP